MRQLSRWSLFLLVVTLSPLLRADFFCKVPEFNPGDAAFGYDVFKPPWYPYDMTEAEKYTVSETGELVERAERDQGLQDYGQKKDKKEEILRTIRQASDRLVFERVLGSPRTVVADFYGHVAGLGVDVQHMTAGPDWTRGQGSLRHNLHNIVKRDDALGSGYPPVPGQRRLLYDGWATAVQTGWDYGKFGGDGGGGVGGGPGGGGSSRNVVHYPTNWRGYLVPNLREFALWYATEGVATSRQCVALLERNKQKERRFAPELAVLRALSGKDYGWNAGKWATEYVGKEVYGVRQAPWPEDHSDWEKAVESTIMLDLTRKRAPLENAFHRLRDVPELSEPIFLELIRSGRADLIMKRNLSMILEGFTSPRAAKALHTLARDKDAVTAVRAVNSLSRHPHGQVREILLQWLDPKADDIRRAKSILMLGRTGRSDLAEKLMLFYPSSADEFEQELVLRSLLRLRHKPALPLFEEAKKKKTFPPLEWIGRMGLAILNDGDDRYEGMALDLIADSFYRADAIPSSGTIVSFSQHLRVDLVKWMAQSRWKRVRRKLWRFIREYQDLGPGSEEHGVAHLLSYGLYELNMEDAIIPQRESAKMLNILASRDSTDVLIRMAAIARLYEFDRAKAVKASKKILERFLKGRKVNVLGFDNEGYATEQDVLSASVNLLLLDDPEDRGAYERVLLNPNINGNIKSRLLENLYRADRKTALAVIKKSIKFYASRHEMPPEDERYLVRLIRFAGLFKDPKILSDVVMWMEKSPDPWIRFISLYACRTALDEEFYEDVFSGTAQERRRLASRIGSSIKALR